MSHPRTILVLTRHTPLPWDDGAGAYLFDVLRFLHTQGFEIHVAWFAPHERAKSRGLWRLPAEFTRVVHLHTPGAWRVGRCQIYPGIYWLPFKARTLHAAKRLLAGVGLRVGRQPSSSDHSQLQTARTLPSTGWMATPSPAEHAFTDELIERLRPTTVIANYAWLTPLFRDDGQGPDYLRVCLHPDVAWQRAALQHSIDGSPHQIDRATETALLARARVVVSISEIDAVSLRTMVPTVTVIVAPKAVSPQPQPRTHASSRRLLFVGSGNGFNAAGLLWFLHEIWPQIRGAEPSVVLDVCGSIASTVPDRPPGVHFHGNVPDLIPYYREAAVVIVPLLHATGLNIKLVDAAALGRAIVTTSATLEGAPFLVDTVTRADSASDFAEAVLDLLRDPTERDRIARLALDVVTRKLSPAACFGPLAARLLAP